MRSLDTPQLHLVALDMVQIGIETHNQDMTNTGLDLCATVIERTFK